MIKKELIEMIEDFPDDILIHIDGKEIMAFHKEYSTIRNIRYINILSE